MRIFSEEKHPVNPDRDMYGSPSVYDQELVLDILDQPTEETRREEMVNRASDGKRDRYEEVFRLFAGQAQEQAGVTAAIPFAGMTYKPIQSLFNKMYVRRGQVSMNLVGDLQRGTVYVNTPKELDQIKRALRQQYQANLDRKIDCIGSLAHMLAEIHACTPMRLTMASGEVVDVIIYRIKDNSSQQERVGKGELSHVMNINFFIDGPQADCSRAATIVGACELQVGVSSTLNTLRGNHRPYEKQRILDGMPQLKHKLDRTPPSKGKLDCDLINKAFNVYHAVKTTGSITRTHKDGKSHAGMGETTYRKGCMSTLYCVNHGRINSWRRERAA